MDETLRWRTVSQERLCWRVWDNEVVIYDNGSGDTHVLSPEGTEILRFLSRHSANNEEVVRHVAAKLGIEINEQLYSDIENALAELDQLGLIKPVLP